MTMANVLDQTAGKPVRLEANLRKQRRERRLWSLRAYAFMAPALILLLVFVFYPILRSIPLSLYRYSVIGQTKYIGLANFRQAFLDPDFWIAMRNSALFVGCVPVLQLVSLVVAVVVNQKLKLVTFFRVLFYLPVVTSTISISIMWSFVFDPNGIVNTFLIAHKVISEPIYFLADTHYALLSLMFVTIWQGIGYYMMIYLAGLQSVPAQLEEAARIDGAGATRIFFQVTLPMLKPYIWFCTLFSVLAALGVFDVVFAMTNGGPAKATLVMNLYTYDKAFRSFEFGYAAAAGLIMSLVTTLFSLIVFIYGRSGGMSYGE